MASSAERPSHEAPLYVRWIAERSPYALELRLDLVPRFVEALTKGAQQGIEIGGVLLGSLLQSGTGPFRVEAFEVIPRAAADGPIFLLNLEQLKQLQQICGAGRLAGYTAIGLFRTHLRTTPLQPTIADRSLLAQHFGQSPHVLLLIEARAPHDSTFFLSGGGELQAQPAMAPFLMDEKALGGLPEVTTEEPAAATRPLPRSNSRSRGLWLLAVAALCSAAFFIWLLQREPTRAAVPAPSNSINLAVTPAGEVLKITWNHSAREISQARSASLSIVDGSRRVHITVSPEDLRVGSIEYQQKTKQVAISLTLDTGGQKVPSQSTRWTGG